MNPEIFLESIKRARLDLFAAKSIRSPNDFPRVNECIDSAYGTLMTIIETMQAERLAKHNAETMTRLERFVAAVPHVKAPR